MQIDEFRSNSVETGGPEMGPYINPNSTALKNKLNKGSTQVSMAMRTPCAPVNERMT